MPLTRHQRRLTDQNASQPIHRLSPELLSEIFLQARPNVFTESEGEGDVWAQFVRCLLNITSVSGHFRHIALNFGALWTVVGFSLRHSEENHCRSALVTMGAFLERAQKRKLHFYFDYHSSTSAPAWFRDNLLTLIGPHVGQVETLYFHQSPIIQVWDHLRILLNKVANVNSLTVRSPHWIRPPPEPISLRHLRELSLINVYHGGFFFESMKQVESLELRFWRDYNLDIRQWSPKLPKLKRLVLFDTDYVGSYTNSSHLPENLTHLETNFRIYPTVLPWLSLQLRHLVIDMDSSDQNLEPQIHRHPSVRTLCMILGGRTVFPLRSAALFITMNPQLEFLEFKWETPGFGKRSGLVDLLSRVLQPTQPQGPTLPGEAPNFPGPSLKYLRLPYIEGLTNGERALLSKQLRFILLRAPGSRLDVARPVRNCTYLRKLMERFPSRVRSHLEPHVGTPLDELYDNFSRDWKSE